MPRGPVRFEFCILHFELRGLHILLHLPVPDRNHAVGEGRDVGFVGDQYDRVAEVTNAAAGDLDVFVSRSSGRSLLATVRPGETQRITIPAGSNGVWCQYANGSAVGTGCRVRYLDANES